MNQVFIANDPLNGSPRLGLENNEIINETAGL